MVAPSKHALVVGASSGIGLGVAKELAPIVAKLTLCSRSYPSELMETIKTKNPNVEVVHEKLNVSLLHEVRTFTTRHAKTQLDWIVMSPGIMTLNGRTGDMGRFMLVHDLVKGLNRPGVRVLNILSAGEGGKIDVNDLDLKHMFSGTRCAAATTQYSDLMTQALSEHATSASFMHASPGVVNTGLFKQLPWYMRMPITGLAAVFARTPETCGKYMVSALLNEDYAKGWKLLNQNAKETTKAKYHTDELKDIVWKHTLQTIDDVMKL